MDFHVLSTAQGHPSTTNSALNLTFKKKKKKKFASGCILSAPIKDKRNTANPIEAEMKKHRNTQFYLSTRKTYLKKSVYNLLKILISFEEEKISSTHVFLNNVLIRNIRIFFF